MVWRDKIMRLLFLFIILLGINIWAFNGSDSLRFNVCKQEKGVYSIRLYNRLLKTFSLIDKDFIIAWDEEYGIPTSISGNFNDKKINIFKAFVKGLPEGIKLKKVKEFKNKSSSHERYVYTYNDLEVVPDIITYSTGIKGFMVAGDFLNNTNVLNEVLIDFSKALNIAKDYLGIKELRNNKIDKKQVYFDTLRGLKSGYMFKISSKVPLGDFTIVVDASNGDILYCENMMVFYEGFASTYVTNPERCKVSVEKIFNITKKGRLYGRYVNVKNDDTDEAYNENNRFIYDIKNTHFDEANMYYYIDSIHKYYAKTFSYNGLNKTMKVIVHYGDKYDNAFFSPWRGILVFGDGNKLNILSREAAVAYHEYTHAVSYDLAGLGTYGEAGAMNEGFSDYFGCTLTDDPLIGEWVMAKLNKPYMRNCDNDSHYPEDIQNEPHRDSLMWSGPCWKLRREFGKEIADQLVHFSRYYINRRSKFVDGLQAILRVDEERFNGTHKEKIIEIFAKHGIIINDIDNRMRIYEKSKVKMFFNK